jgi:hypothetical protein
MVRGCVAGARLASSFDYEWDAVFGAETDCGIQSDFAGCAGGWGEAPVTGDGGEGEDAFHPGQAFADALAATGGEGEEGEAGARLVGFAVGWREALRVEAEWIGEEARVAVDDELRDEEDGFTRDGVAGESRRGSAQVRAVTQTGG